jgi:hypothetical protein
MFGYSRAVITKLVTGVQQLTGDAASSAKKRKGAIGCDRAFFVGQSGVICV